MSVTLQQAREVLESAELIYDARQIEQALDKLANKINETVVQKESTITLLTVRIVNLFSSLDVFHCLDDESSAVVCVGPSSLPGSLVVEHIGISYKAVSLHTLNLNTEDSAGYHHPNF